MKSKIHPEQVVQMADNLRNNLNSSPLKLKNKQHHRLPVDLTDVYTICLDCTHLIEQLMKEENWIDTAKLRKIIFDLESQLFTHLPYHYKPLKKTLDKIYRQITTEKDNENDLAEILETAQQFLQKSKEINKAENTCLKPKKTDKKKAGKTKKSK